MFGHDRLVGGRGGDLGKQPVALREALPARLEDSWGGFRVTFGQLKELSGLLQPRVGLLELPELPYRGSSGASFITTAFGELCESLFTSFTIYYRGDVGGSITTECPERILSGAMAGRSDPSRRDGVRPETAARATNLNVMESYDERRRTD